jgi:Zn-dependent peptidase ImmA (M78 family)
MKFNSYQEWVKCITEIGDEDIEWFERQAHEFAGSLLVPRTKLIELAEKQSQQISDFIKGSDSEETKESVTIGISRIFSEKFMVSAKVIEQRIHKEKILEEIGFFI